MPSSGYVTRDLHPTQQPPESNASLGQSGSHGTPPYAVCAPGPCPASKNAPRTRRHSTPPCPLTHVHRRPLHTSRRSLSSLPACRPERRSPFPARCTAYPLTHPGSDGRPRGVSVASLARHHPFVLGRPVVGGTDGPSPRGRRVPSGPMQTLARAC